MKEDVDGSIHLGRQLPFNPSTANDPNGDGSHGMLSKSAEKGEFRLPWVGQGPSMTTTRFAPSPTGHLHIGNLRTALFNFLISRKSGGTFILRLDDTDPERSRPEFADSIRFDLDWLGLHWDRIERQSDRLELYAEAADRLRQSGRLYECFETPEELSLKRRVQLRAGKAPVYDREGLFLTKEQRDELGAVRPGYWRFRLDRERIEWDDGIQGRISIDAASVSDPVLVRADGQFLYTHASVVDDIDMGISNIVRGADHITNTATQIQIMRQLGAEPPIFAHHSMLTGKDGGPLAKRTGSHSVRGLRQAGIEPMTILSMLASVGTSDPPRFVPEPEELAGLFDLAAFSAAPARIDDGDFRAFNAKVLASSPFEFAAEAVSELDVPPNLAHRFWETTRENISTMAELRDWWSIFRDGADSVVEPADSEFVRLALDMLPEPPYGADTWKSWTGLVSERTGRRGKSLFMPLRLALTGRRSGPDMSNVMQLVQVVRR